MKESNITLIVCLLAAAVMPGRVHPASAQIPPAVQKKAVSLSHSHVMAENFFTGNCGKCHKLPDPANRLTPRADCTGGIPEFGVSMVREYLAEVRAGKELYESRCGRCHNLIDPRSYSADYWSKNLCTSEECFVEKLQAEEEQQVLLYLSSHAKGN